MLDSEPLFAAGRAELLARYGLTASAQGNISGSGMRAFWQSVLDASRKENVPTAAELARLNFEFCLSRIVSDSVPPADGLIELLDFLRSNDYSLSVASSSDRFYVETVLKHLKIEGYFDRMVCGDDVARAKPFPDIYAAAAKATGLPLSECAAIEDSDNGIASARAAGLACIGVDSAVPKTQSFEGCTVKVDSLCEIIDFLRMERAD